MSVRTAFEIRRIKTQVFQSNEMLIMFIKALFVNRPVCNNRYT